MRLTVLGGCGAWPTAGQPCSGYLVEHDGFRVLLDPGYGTMAALQTIMPVDDLDAVIVSHGHPDHCADLNPLLRARALGDGQPPALPVYALPQALDAVLALDRPAMLAPALDLREFADGDSFSVGPFRVDSWLLPHFVPNAGLRLTADGRTLAYTGDTGPSEQIVTMADRADIFLAEATFAERIRPADNAPYLSTAVQAGEYARKAQVGRLVLTHLWPGSDPATVLDAARTGYDGPSEVATPGLVVD